MDRTYSQSGELLVAQSAGAADRPEPRLARELAAEAEAERCGLTVEEFASVLGRVGAKTNFGQAPGRQASAGERAAFWRGLRLGELALAHGCALGRDRAWERFVQEFRGPLTQAAIGVTGSATLGHDLADALYAELFGLQEQGGQRKSPLSSFTGRGSLMGWLRTTLAQRHVDHHRRTFREAPLDPEQDPAAPPVQAAAQAGELSIVAGALEKTLAALPAEERFLLAAYFLDRQTLQTLAGTLRVHEATVSRRLKRLVEELRKRLLSNLQLPPGSLSRRAAEEALGTDPRDLEINLRAILQTSQIAPFSHQGTEAERRLAGA